LTIGTDEGEFTEYLGCELIRDRSAAKTGTIVQKGYPERVLKTFGMWDYKPSATPLDTNSRLSKAD
jgi:V8-like Glu-specific endopeptidase